MQPFGVSLFLPDAQRALEQPGRGGLRVGGRGLVIGRGSVIGLRSVWTPAAFAGFRRLRCDGGYPRQRVVGDELVARGGQRPAAGTGHADADHVAAQSLAALGERDVIRVAPDDDHMGQVGQPEHVLDRIDGQPDVGAVLAVTGCRKQLHQIDCAADELTMVSGVDVGGPIRIGAGEHQSSE